MIRERRPIRILTGRADAMYLRVHSWYSLRHGVLSPDRLLDLAEAHGLRELVLTDINTTMGLPEFVKKATERSVRPIAGCEFRHNHRLLYTALARNREGLREINELITARNCDGIPFPEEAPPFSEVYVIYPYGRKLSRPLRENERWGVAPSDAGKFRLSGSSLSDGAAVLSAPITFTSPREAELHKILRAIDANVLISRLGEADSDAASGRFIPLDALKALFREKGALWANTRALLNDCSISFSFSASKNRKLFTNSPAGDAERLRSLALEGLRLRYGVHNQEAERRVHQELSVINKLGFSAYFLIAADMVAYSMSVNISHVGRGSGANSIVAYCLQITDVDPISLDLYFERFLNPLRSSPPDFDIDYSW
ncbi:MAG: PHP domain-containing protein, partial [Bacteroidales bacterium]